MFGSKKLNNTDDVVELILARFYSDFARECSVCVLENEAIGLLYELAVGHGVSERSKAQREMILFRAAYVLEKVYFARKELFEPFVEKFWDDMPQTESESAKRHFGKIALDLLRTNHSPTPTQCQSLAEACATWAADSKSRAAVRIWAVEIFLMLRHRVDWVNDLLPEILEVFKYDSSPAIVARVRMWCKKVTI